ncbi:MAG TPA: polysaccharide deacetylase family protein, partial [Acidobacteriaceae bacterium]|nr:polysaccharide deacetylase family protein [Acidobacteriaceae bacterium]
AKYQVRAIFFMIGNFARRRPDLARAVQKAGHLIGNHTMSHPSLIWERPSRVREELAGCNAVLEDVLGEPVHYFRPPFGSRRPDVLRTAVELGLRPVMWNVTAHDWDATDSVSLAARVQHLVDRNQRLGRGSNILLHDGGHLELGTDRSVTLATTKILLDRWAGSNLRNVAIDTWN